MTAQTFDTEYWEAVQDFHEPGTPPTTCYWCGLPCPCPAYLRAQAALIRLT
jgi:hypothetical protein